MAVWPSRSLKKRLKGFILKRMDSVITRDPGVLGGLPVFRGTRVPIKNLFDCLEKGYTVREFLEDFPAVSEEQVKLLLKEVERELKLTAA